MVSSYCSKIIKLNSASLLSSCFNIQPTEWKRKSPKWQFLLYTFMASCWLHPSPFTIYSTVFSDSPECSKESCFKWHSNQYGQNWGSSSNLDVPKSLFIWHIWKNICYLIDLVNSVLPTSSLVIPSSLVSIPSSLLLYVPLSQPILMICSLFFFTSTDFELFDAKNWVWTPVQHNAWHKTWQREKMLGSVTDEWMCSL